MSSGSENWLIILDELENRVTKHPVILDEQLREWVADSVAAFSQLGVSPEIIRGFMRTFEFSGSAEYEAPRAWKAVYQYWSGPAAQAVRVRGFFYPNIAFVTARALVKRVAEDERLVPQSLVDLLKSDAKYAHLAISLESMEKAHAVKDLPSLLAATNALLGEVIDLHGDTRLQGKSGLKKKLDYLAIRNNAKLLADFGVDAELMALLSNFRYLRNKTSQHRQRAYPKLPLSLGHGFAALVLLLLYATQAQGTLIKA